eukprot:CAMPEP_0202954016 /NCGR_PEP_ID=MMETSP1395-20130829/49895_1 /ASSEMBLY_ACC=CAM_ASM_000871 /TAXON_ID=5961 /ORGANISM="Blepharisma japonicum, Strain Stock R1072" /LENGTH=74 /DNA_ID=CAMNT_0049669085 /DNA_START=422 /DNA_END=646 /DNA_ORIENTATION=-
METCLKGTELTRKLMGKVYILIQMELFMKETEEMISKKALELKSGLMAASIKDSIRMGKSMVLEFTIGVMEVFM